MKKLLFLSFLTTTITINAQNTFPSNGNVGIGTLTPTEKLEVVGTVKAELGVFGNPLPNSYTFTDYSDRNNKSRIIGLGTKPTPTSYLFNLYDFPQSNLNAKSEVFFGINDRSDESRFRYYAQTNGLSEMIFYNKSQSTVYRLKEDGNDNIYLNLPKNNSYLSIGTTSYSDNGELYKLTVNGKVRAHAVKVYTDWADFVFDDNYSLPTLEDVESYIEEHGHLQNIPSAEEVEEDGIELGEMNKLLLQKIEELTLYTIQLKKEMDNLKAKIDQK